MSGERVAQVASTGAPAAAAAATAHPSSPIPVHGKPLGADIRVDLGETGMRIFPLVLGGSDFGWTIDLAHLGRLRIGPERAHHRPMARQPGQP